MSPHYRKLMSCLIINLLIVISFFQPVNVNAKKYYYHPPLTTWQRYQKIAKNNQTKYSKQAILDPNTPIKDRFLNFNVNLVLPENNYQLNQTMYFIPTNNTYLLSHVPTSELDQSNPITGDTEQYYQTQITVLKKQFSNFGQPYYQIKTNDGTTGWVMGSRLTNNINNLNSSQNELNQASQYWALNYINYVRYQHHRKPLKINPKLNHIADQRTDQLPKVFDHYDRNNNNQRFADKLAKQDGYDTRIYSFLGENVSEAPLQKSPRDTIINTINDMLYDDQKDSNWGHRKSFLDPDIDSVGINMKIVNGYYYISFNFR